MKLLRPKKKMIRPRLESLVKFKRNGIGCFIMVNGLIHFYIGDFNCDNDATLACWRVMGSM